MLLHTLRSALHVHHNIRYVQCRNGMEHIRIHLTGRNIIDDGNTILLHTHSCHIRPESVYRHHSIRLYLKKYFQAHTQPFHLLPGGDIVGIGTGRVSAYVNNGRSLRNYLFHPACYFRLCLCTATGIKGIGSNVQYAHDTRLREVEQRTVDIYISGSCNFHRQSVLYSTCKCKQKSGFKIHKLIKLISFLPVPGKGED